MTMRRILHVAFTAMTFWLVLSMPAFGQELQGDDLARWLRKRPNVSRITIEGNHALDDGDVRNVMQVRSPGTWARLHLRSKPRLLAAAMRRDEASIRDEYLRRGYWSASVSITAQPDEKRDEAAVRVSVTEGSRSYWGDVTFDGDHEGLVALLSRRAARLKRGAPADSLFLAYMRSRMRAECADRAHPAAAIDAVVTPRGDSVDVVFSLTAGPDVVLGDLSIDGLKHTRESTVRRELRLKAGDPYSRKKLDDRQQDIYATGLFTYVRLETAYADTIADTATRTANMHLRTVERKPSFIGFRTGSGQHAAYDLTWDYALEWGSRNWLGTGRKWSLTAQSEFVVVTKWRILHHRFAARYVEPWIFGLHLPTALEISYEPGMRSATQPYHEEWKSVELTVNRRFRRSYHIWSSLIYELLTIYGVPIDQREKYIEESGRTIRKRWSFALERDTRPNLFVPTSGARTRIDLQYVGGILGGENDFYKVDISWARYQTVSAPSVFASRVRVGWEGVHSGDNAIPTVDRFYLGGANSIRGYSEKAVGPFDLTGTPIGGKVVLLGNLELRTPVKGKFWFTLFGDAGNNWLSFHDVSLQETLVSVGIGWQYIAPVGPIRLDYARRVIHPGHPASDRLHLSILFSF